MMNESLMKPAEVVDKINWSDVKFVAANEGDNGPLNGYIEITGDVDLVDTLGAIELGNEEV